MKYSPMKNTKKPDLSKKGQHTFNNHFNLKEVQTTRKNTRKAKQAQRWEAWTA